MLFRPPLQAQTLQMLLDLTTHPEKKTRLPAINTVKRWSSGDQHIAVEIRKFALQMARKLIIQEVKPQMGDVDMEDGEEQEVETAVSTYLPLSVETPLGMEVVRQHLELLLGLTHRQPALLEE